MIKFIEVPTALGPVLFNVSHIVGIGLTSDEQTYIALAPPLPGEPRMCRVAVPYHTLRRELVALAGNSQALHSFVIIEVPVPASLLPLQLRAENLALDFLQKDPTRADLVLLEADIAAVAQAAGRGPVGLAANLAKSAVSAAIARYEVRYLLERAALGDIAQHLVLAAGHLARAQSDGAAVGSG